MKYHDHPKTALQIKRNTMSSGSGTAEVHTMELDATR